MIAAALEAWGEEDRQTAASPPTPAPPHWPPATTASPPTPAPTHWPPLHGAHSAAQTAAAARRKAMALRSLQAPSM